MVARLFQFVEILAWTGCSCLGVCCLSRDCFVSLTNPEVWVQSLTSEISDTFDTCSSISHPVNVSRFAVVDVEA